LNRNWGWNRSRSRNLQRRLSRLRSFHNNYRRRHEIATADSGSRSRCRSSDRFDRNDSRRRRRILRLAGIAHVRHIAAVRRHAVVDGLDAAVGQRHGVAAHRVRAVALLAHVEAGAGEAVRDGVQVAIGGRQIVVIVHGGGLLRWRYHIAKRRADGSRRNKQLDACCRHVFFVSPCLGGSGTRTVLR
jgi:hypothetical protein